MNIHMTVNGYHDWEPAALHPEFVVTEADFKQRRAKRMANGDVHIKVEREAHLKNDKGELDHGHDITIPEAAICRYIAEQAIFAGNEHTREDVALHLVHQSTFDKKAGLLSKRHVETVTVNDDGPQPDVMKQWLDYAIATVVLSAKTNGETLDPASFKSVADATLARYTEETDIQASLTALYVRRKKGA